ncbi:uncharacterized protein [Fopius arisanus]|uniref:Uncharacterized protein n=3 Tax=Fopius arisanus TaxID=64838 RepID=A0A9R1TGS2_9HYME|nr:PREDICTED: uncharacterized protein LOC105270248 [Fopius arisanus]
MRNSSLSPKLRLFAGNHSFIEIITIEMIIIAIFLVTMSTSFIEAVEVHQNTRAPFSHRRQYQGVDAPFQGNHRTASQEGYANSRDNNQIEKNLAYKPFESAPNHIKRLIYDAYGPQQTYVNPHAFFYKNYVGLPDDFLTSGDQHERRQGQEALETVVSSTAQPISYRTGYPQRSDAVAQVRSNMLQKGGIKYKEGHNQNDQPQLFSPHRNYGLVNSLRSHRNSEQMKRSPDPEVSEDEENQEHAMPPAIQTLLNYQAQIPYNVLANHIVFETKKPFVPKPLPQDLKSSSQYPSEIFYIKADGQILEEVPTMGVSGGQINYNNS